MASTPGRSMPPGRGTGGLAGGDLPWVCGPNADGTYHYWLSIRIDPKERGRYQCHVEHDGLQKPLDLALEEPTNSKPNLGLIIIGCVVAALVLVGVIAGILVFFTGVDSPSMRREERRWDRPPSELGRTLRRSPSGPPSLPGTRIYLGSFMIAFIIESVTVFNLIEEQRKKENLMCL
ncbi:putative MHC class I antigen protein [Naja naja]|nr:putative MHC class I antigen protein [Naja naja]